MKSIVSTLFCFVSIISYGQMAVDFTITDTDGIERSLFADHIDQGQTVVLKLFFTSCPPCISIAPQVQGSYEQWGEGQYDVEFIELSTQAFDSNADVAQYKNTYNLTFPGAGKDGGSLDAVIPYRDGVFGIFFGTPTLIVISSDGTVNYNVHVDDLNDAIAATGATGMDNGGMTDEVTSYNINGTNASSSQPTNLKYFLKPANADSPKYDILDITGGSFDFDYPSENFPELTDPVITIEASGDIIDGSTNVLDLLNMRKHILELEPFTNENQLLAADVNSDDKINALDLLNLQKALLDLISEFPNDTPSWKVSPAQIPLTENIGGMENLDFTIVKTGNVN